MGEIPAILREGKLFEGDSDFAAWDAAVAWLKARGFSVGLMQAHSPTGAMFGVYDIQKWRNLRLIERRALHAVVIADNCRFGPVKIRLMPMASGEAVAAFLKDDAP